jgi:glycolate oxidase
MSSRPDRARLRAALQAIVGVDGVLTEPDELLVYESDGLTIFRATADAVVFPRTTAEVAACVKLANAEGLPFVARGAGTGLAGGCLASEGGIVIAVTRMARILEVDYANQLACTIGGNVANNSGGPHTLKYGVTTNHVLGVEVVLPDGEVVWLGGKVRDPQGYDLVGLFVGSEGTFGIVTKVVVRIVRRPPAVRTLLAVFDQLDQASRTVAAITARGLTPAAIEMIDQLTIQAVEDAFGAGYPRDAAAALLIELDGLETGLDDEAAHVVAACREAGARDVRLAQTEVERQLLWKGRKLAFGAYGRVAPAYMVMDGVIPRTRLPEVLRNIERIVTTHSLRVGNVFHAGDGNLHPNILYDPRKPGEEARVLAAGAEIMRACVDAGGTISGEHGIGLEKRDFMPWIFSEADLATMAAIKAVFNPTGRCNPGKIFPTRKSCAPGEIAYQPHPLEASGLIQRL